MLQHHIVIDNNNNVEIKRHSIHMINNNLPSDHHDFWLIPLDHDASNSGSTSSHVECHLSSDHHAFWLILSDRHTSNSGSTSSYAEFHVPSDN